jgi:hypothetical protein
LITRRANASSSAMTTRKGVSADVRESISCPNP